MVKRMSKILKKAYHGKDTVILGLSYLDNEDGSVTFLVQTLDYDIVLGRRDKKYYKDNKEAKQAFDYFNKKIGYNPHE
mgnify:CR=1 FL=1